MTRHLDIEIVIKTHYPALQRLARSYEVNLALSEELAQEMVEAIWRGWKSYRGEASVKTYIFRIAHYRAARHIEKQLKRIESNSDQSSEQPDFRHPESHAEQQQHVRTLLDAIRTLPIVQRQLITMSLDGFSYQEMAEVTGMSSNHVGVSLNRAKAALKKILEQSDVG